MRLFMGWILAGLSAGAECVLRWEEGAVPAVFCPHFVCTAQNYKGSFLV